MAAASRRSLINFKVTPQERRFYRTVAEESGITLSELVRVSIVTEAIRLGIPAPEADALPVEA